MKRRMICLAGLLLSFCVLFTGCSPAFDVASEPVPDDASQEFNTPNQFLPLALPTKSGGTCEAAVKAEITYDLDNGEGLMKEVLADEKNVVEASPEWEADQMRIVKIRVLVMPWGDTDFTADLPEFTILFGARSGGGYSGVSAGPDEDPRNPGQAQDKSGTPLDCSKLFRDHSEVWGTDVWSDDETEFEWYPYSYYYSPTTLIESDKPYYETGAYAVIPKEEELSDDFEYLVAVISEDYHKTFVLRDFEEILPEEKLVWKIV